MNSKLLCAAWLAVASASCLAAQPNVEKVEQQVQEPVNCATAEGDLRVLQSEKASTARMMADGVKSITPIGLVVGAATRTEKDKLMIASGDYNKMIDQKIVQIKSACGIQ